jgi:hypothetical protein
MPPSKTGTVDFSSYKAVRDEIAHEDNLAGMRLNWFMASQSFLLTALAIAHTGLNQTRPTPRNDFFFPLVPLLAITTCIPIILGIIGGAIALRRWRHLLDQMIREDPALPAIGQDSLLVRFGWAAPLLLPIVFLIAWTYVLVVGYL